MEKEKEKAGMREAERVTREQETGNIVRLLPHIWQNFTGRERSTKECEGAVAAMEKRGGTAIRSQ